MEILIEVRDVFELFPESLGHFLPLLHPFFFRDALPFIGATDECVQECFFRDQAIQNDRQIHPDIMKLVSNIVETGAHGGFIPGAVQIFPVGSEFFFEIIGGGVGVGDEMPRPQIVLAEGLVDILGAGFRVLKQFALDDVPCSWLKRAPASVKKEQHRCGDQCRP